jgi:hypothetical protein
MRETRENFLFSFVRSKFVNDFLLLRLRVYGNSEHGHAMSRASLEFVRCLFAKTAWQGSLRTALPCTCRGRPGARQYRPTGDSLSEQKYRQHGYQDRDRGERQKPSPDRSDTRPAKADHFGPRPLQLAATHSVSRCGQCGTLLNSLPEPVGKCPKCGFELHSCKQCTYFDPASRFECTQPIKERVARKDQLNSCTFYSISVRVEKQTSTPVSARPADAKQAFENLFKK